MENTASQLSSYGLEKLQNDIGEGEFAVFFRNNHFSVLHKREDTLYLLVTDQGYLYQQKIMWELFDSVDGDSHFVGPDFVLYNPEDATPEGIVANNEILADSQLAEQLQREEEEARKKANEDERIAQEKADHEMALKLQQEMDGGGEDNVLAPIAQPMGQGSQPPAALTGSSNPGAPGQLSPLEELYRAHQQGVQLTPEQTQQLNAFLSQGNANGDCSVM